VLVRSSQLVLASSLDPLWADAFNAVGSHYVLPRQAALTMWYMTAEPYRVNVLHIGVRDLGEGEWSCQCCTGPAFVRVSIFLTSCGHLIFAMTYHGSPRGAGSQAV
jgi:hypothetical protein